MAAPVSPAYDESVFINCPFDQQYLKIFYAVVFAVIDCGFIARCALEKDDGGEVRVHKILRIIRECRVGIHDISRTEISSSSKLPRFNMPLELEMFLGAKRIRKLPTVAEGLPRARPGPLPIPEVHLRHRRPRHPRARHQGGKRSSRSSETSSAVCNQESSSRDPGSFTNATLRSPLICPRFVPESASRRRNSSSTITAPSCRSG